MTVSTASFSLAFNGNATIAARPASNQLVHLGPTDRAPPTSSIIQGCSSSRSKLATAQPVRSDLQSSESSLGAPANAASHLRSRRTSLLRTYRKREMGWDFTSL